MIKWAARIYKILAQVNKFLAWVQNLVWVSMGSKFSVGWRVSKFGAGLKFYVGQNLINFRT